MTTANSGGGGLMASAPAVEVSSLEVLRKVRRVIDDGLDVLPGDDPFGDRLRELSVALAELERLGRARLL